MFPLCVLLVVCIRVVTGHQPHGDAPLIIQCAEEVQVISGDTSYAAAVQYRPSNYMENMSLATTHCSRPCPVGSTRGIAVSEVSISHAGVSATSSQVRIHGVLNNGILKILGII